MFKITVALPLSFGKIVRSVFFFMERNASLWALVRLSLGLEELFMILTVSSLASSAVSSGRNCIAFSTPARISSIGVLRGVTAKLNPFCSSECNASSSVWLLRLTTVPLDGLVGGCCDLWSRENFLCCLVLLSSPTRVAFSKVSWSIRDQSGLDTKFPRRRCLFSNSQDVLSNYRLL